MGLRSVGVEEELLLVEPRTGRPRAMAGTVLHAAGQADPGPGAEPGTGAVAPDAAKALESELQLQQLETNTRPCHALDELGREIRRCRALAAEAAGRAGVQVAALGTSPVGVEPELTRSSRYKKMADAFGLTAYEQLTCGCHVHVQVSSAEEGVAVLDRIGPWLAILLALSANSPFWQGRDSAYASFRHQAWGRWPSAGPTAVFGSAQAYQDTVRQMLRTGTVLDSGMIYFDARLSERYPTVEIRIADVCLRADDAVLIGALARGLVETAARAWHQGRPARPVRAELLRLAAWRASRSGIAEVLLNPATGLPEQPAAVVGLLLEYLSDALADAGDADTVTGLLAAVFQRGNGAAFQRSVYRRSGSLPEVVSSAVAATAPSPHELQTRSAITRPAATWPLAQDPACRPTRGHMGSDLVPATLGQYRSGGKCASDGLETLFLDCRELFPGAGGELREVELGQPGVVQRIEAPP
jgi:glutamate---cysteine ligase / carboxylate-amine ligase